MPVLGSLHMTCTPVYLPGQDEKELVEAGPTKLRPGQHQATVPVLNSLHMTCTPVYLPGQDEEELVEAGPTKLRPGQHEATATQSSDSNLV